MRTILIANFETHAPRPIVDPVPRIGQFPFPVVGSVQTMDNVMVGRYPEPQKNIPGLRFVGRNIFCDLLYSEIFSVIFLLDPACFHEEFLIFSGKPDQVLGPAIVEFVLFLDLIGAERIISCQHIHFSVRKTGTETDRVWFQRFNFKNSPGEVVQQQIRCVEVRTGMQLE